MNIKSRQNAGRVSDQKSTKQKEEGYGKWEEGKKSK